MNDRERWKLFVDVAAVVWIGLFAVDVANEYGGLVLSESVQAGVGIGLRALLVVFLLDVVLLYRWSDQDLRPFVRSNWLWIVTVVPWFRPLRLLRAGRGLRGLRVLVGSRRVGSLLNKLRRTGKRLWRRRGE